MSEGREGGRGEGRGGRGRGEEVRGREGGRERGGEGEGRGGSGEGRGGRGREGGREREGREREGRRGEGERGREGEGRGTCSRFFDHAIGTTGVLHPDKCKMQQPHPFGFLINSSYMSSNYRHTSFERMLISASNQSGQSRSPQKRNFCSRGKN